MYANCLALVLSLDSRSSSFPSSAFTLIEFAINCLSKCVPDLGSVAKIKSLDGSIPRAFIRAQYLGACKYGLVASHAYFNFLLVLCTNISIRCFYQYIICPLPGPFFVCLAFSLFCFLSKSFLTLLQICILLPFIILFRHYGTPLPCPVSGICFF